MKMGNDMSQVTSKDGTTIAFDQSGTGPAVILVSGALGIRSHPIMAGLAECLASHFTVFNYDRRGRGESADTAPYAVEREIEDIEALIDNAGGSAFLYGLSSGAALVLEAANKLPNKVKKLALYEPPYIVDDSFPAVPDDYVQQLNKATSEDRPGDAVEIFMTQALHLPPEYLVPMRNDPMWALMVSAEHTLVYDAAVMGDTQRGKQLPPKRWLSATSPTLVITGENSPAFFHNAAKALVDILPNPQHPILPGQ